MPTRSPTQARGPGQPEMSDKSSLVRWALPEPSLRCLDPERWGGGTERGNREQESLSAITQAGQAGPPFPDRTLGQAGRGPGGAGALGS